MDEQNNPPVGNPVTSPTGAPIYQESPPEKNAKWPWLLIIVIIIGALVFAFFKGIGPFAKFRKGQTTEASPTPQVLSSPSPEASPQSEKLDKTKPQIRVLNGSGVAGVASSFKDFIEGLGYKVASLGNADSYDFSQTEIRFKEDSKKYQDTLVSDLSNKYSVKVSSKDLSSTDSADIEIIVGKK